jgi:cyclase
MRIAAALAVVLFAVAGAARAQSFPEPRVVAINARVHVLLGPVQHANRVNRGYMVNSTLIVGDRGAILIDSGGTLEVGRHIRAAVRRITDKPVTHVVNTHHHGDHYLGNAAFEGATIISSEKCRRLVEETGSAWLRIMEDAVGEPLTGTRPMAATVTYPQGARIETTIHGVRLEFRVPLGSHTAGDLLVYLPDDKVLVAGDVLVRGIVPTLQDGYLRNWIRTLDEIAAMGDLRFVPGHGDLMTQRDVAAQREGLVRFHAGMKQGYKRGLAEQQMRKSLDLSAWERLERAYVIDRNINRAYLEVEAEVFDE